MAAVTVTVTYHSPDDVRIDPPLALIDRLNQEIVWNLVNASTDKVSFRVPGGIFFPWPITAPPPPPEEPAYYPWPGRQPQGDATTYRANAENPMGGILSKFYLYYIALETSSGSILFRKARHPQTLDLIDPPVENEPKP